MSMVDQGANPRRLVRVASAALAVAGLLAVVLLTTQWLPVFFTRSLLRRAAIGFLVALEAAYIIGVVALLAGTFACGALLRRARRNRAKWQTWARGLLLCVCSLLALGSAELATGLQRWWNQRSELMVGAERDLPERFAEPESANELTLAVLGESSAFGTPFERWFSIGKIVAWQLELAVPGRKVRVEMLARRADTLADQYRRLARLSKRPDALIVYCGHNEFLNDVPWFRTVIHYHDEEPPLGAQDR